MHNLPRFGFALRLTGATLGTALLGLAACSSAGPPAPTQPSVTLAPPGSLSLPETCGLLTAASQQIINDMQAFSYANGGDEAKTAQAALDWQAALAKHRGSLEQVATQTADPRLKETLAIYAIAVADAEARAKAAPPKDALAASQQVAGFAAGVEQVNRLCANPAT
jgi:hypothetical protein